MGRNSIQFQKGLSVPEFQRLYGTEAQCEETLAHMRWPDGLPESRQVVEIPWGLSPGVAGAELTTAQGSCA